MEQELTMEELVSLMEKKEGDFMIHVEFGKERIEDGREKTIVSS